MLSHGFEALEREGVLRFRSRGGRPAPPFRPRKPEPGRPRPEVPPRRLRAGCAGASTQAPARDPGDIPAKGRSATERTRTEIAGRAVRGPRINRSRAIPGPPVFPTSKNKPDAAAGVARLPRARNPPKKSPTRKETRRCPVTTYPPRRNPDSEGDARYPVTATPKKIPNTGAGRDRGSSPARGGGAPKERRGRNDTPAPVTTIKGDRPHDRHPRLG